MTIEINEKQKEKFFLKVQKTNKCWIWIGSIDPYGYGSFYCELNKRQIKAHRLSYLIHNMKLDNDLFCCHSCDVRNCVNPEHLFLGTPKDNTRDMINKKRDKNSRKTHCKNGHELSSDNLIKLKNENDKRRICRICVIDYHKNHRLKVNNDKDLLMAKRKYQREYMKRWRECQKNR